MHLVLFLAQTLISLCAGVKIITNRCDPPLPMPWFLSHAQSLSLSSFSQGLQETFRVAGEKFSRSTEEILNGAGQKISAASVAVAGPWGHVLDYNTGKLRSNDSKDSRTVDGNSIYRIASMSKVRVRPDETDVDAYSVGITDSTRKGCSVDG
jgi:hypothetical protein